MNTMILYQGEVITITVAAMESENTVFIILSSLLESHEQ